MGNVTLASFLHNRNLKFFLSLKIRLGFWLVTWFNLQFSRSDAGTPTSFRPFVFYFISEQLRTAGKPGIDLDSDYRRSSSKGEVIFLAFNTKD